MNHLTFNSIDVLYRGIIGSVHNSLRVDRMVKKAYCVLDVIGWSSEYELGSRHAAL